MRPWKEDVRTLQDYVVAQRCTYFTQMAKRDVESRWAKQCQVSDYKRKTCFSFDCFLSHGFSSSLSPSFNVFCRMKPFKDECPLSSSLTMSHMFALAFWRCPDFAGLRLHGQAPWSAALLVLADFRRPCRVWIPGFSLTRLFIGSGGLSQYLQIISFQVEFCELCGLFVVSAFLWMHALRFECNAFPPLPTMFDVVDSACSAWRNIFRYIGDYLHLGGNSP